MKLTFIGVGSAFALNNFQSNMLLETQGRRLLIDCGGDARFSLNRLGLGAADIDAVYISHLHADHVGGLEWLCFSRYFAEGPMPELYINERLADILWEQSLRGGMASVQEKAMTLDDFFSFVHRLPPNGSFDFGGASCRPFSTVHYFDCYELVPSYGLVIDAYPEDQAFPSPQGNTDEPATKVMLTTDTQFCPAQLMNFYQSADIIFQDCETAAWKSGVHAHYQDLLSLPEEIRAKMWLYHYQDGPLPDAHRDGFLGFIRQGQCFEF